MVQEELDEVTEKWKLAIILYVVGETPTIGAIEWFIAAQWNFVAKPKVYFHNDGYFVVRFTSMDDMNAAFYSGPHTINSKPIITKGWTLILTTKCWKLSIMGKVSQSTIQLLEYENS